MICSGRKFLLEVFLSTVKLGHIIENFIWSPKGKSYKMNIIFSYNQFVNRL